MSADYCLYITTACRLKREMFIVRVKNLTSHKIWLRVYFTEKHMTIRYDLIIKNFVENFKNGYLYFFQINMRPPIQKISNWSYLEVLKS